MKKFYYAMLLLLTSFNCYAQSLTVLLDWFPNPHHAPLYVAEQQGYFKEQGLDVKLIGPADPMDPPKLVAAGKADIAITNEPQFMEQIDRGLPLIRIGTLINHPLDCLVTLKSSHIKTIADLKNKRIGVSTGGTTGIMLKTMLEHSGLNVHDVNIINVRYNLTQALFSRKIDAATGLMRTLEVVQLELAGHPVHVFYPEQFGVPNYSELIFVARKDRLTDPSLYKFMIAVKKGRDYLVQRPEATWTQFAKQFPENNNTLNHKAWLGLVPYFAQDPLTFDQKEWIQFAEFMHKNNLIKKVQPMDSYAVILSDQP